MYPLKMVPAIKEYIWGGNNLKEKFNKKYPFEKAGESWEVSTHSDGKSRIANGRYKGRLLSDVIACNSGICGSKDYDFPLMFKIIDANRDLSIQVHPDDEYAKLHENSERGKDEMWYVLDCDSDSRIGYGFNRPMTKEQISAAVSDGSLEKYIRYIKVKKGEAYFIPAGTVHCLCSGLLIAELLQKSNVTYRLYDYNRKGSDGKPRELHVDKALDVLENADNPPVALVDKGREVENLFSCEKFSCDKINCKKEVSHDTNGIYHILFFTEGAGRIKFGFRGLRWVNFAAGDTFVIPSKLGKYKVMGRCGYLKCNE